MGLVADVVFKAPRLEEKEFKELRGKHIALVSGKIVSVGDTSREAFEEALRKNPKLRPSEVALYMVPDADELIL